MSEEKNTRVRKLLGGVILVAALLGGLALARGMHTGVAGVEVADRAPDYTAVTLDGVEHSIAEYRGEVLLLNVWATWCGPCRMEMPPIKALYERFKDRGFTVLAVSIDAGPGYRDKVAKFIEEYQLDFPVLLDPEGRIGRTFRTAGVPETFVIDRQGRIVKRHIGATNWDSPSNRKLIDQLLRM